MSGPTTTARTTRREDLRQVAEPRGKVRHWAEATEAPPPGLSRIGRALCRVIVLHRVDDIPGATERPMCQRCQTLHDRATTTLFEVWSDRATVEQVLADVMAKPGSEVVEEPKIRAAGSRASFYGRVRLRPMNPPETTDGAP